MIRILPWVTGLIWTLLEGQRVNLVSGVRALCIDINYTIACGIGFGHARGLGFLRGVYGGAI